MPRRRLPLDSVFAVGRAMAHARRPPRPHGANRPVHPFVEPAVEPVAHEPRHLLRELEEGAMEGSVREGVRRLRDDFGGRPFFTEVAFDDEALERLRRPSHDVVSFRELLDERLAELAPSPPEAGGRLRLAKLLEDGAEREFPQEVVAALRIAGHDGFRGRAEDLRRPTHFLLRTKRGFLDQAFADQDGEVVPERHGGNPQETDEFAGGPRTHGDGLENPCPRLAPKAC